MKESSWWGLIAVTILLTLVGIFFSAKHELAMDQKCKSQRIVPFPEKMFYWQGMVELGQKGEYQPKCL